jgi:hypothetical protein
MVEGDQPGYLAVVGTELVDVGALGRLEAFVARLCREWPADLPALEVAVWQDRSAEELAPRLVALLQTGAAGLPLVRWL